MPRWSHFEAVPAWPTVAAYASRGHLVATNAARVRVSPDAAELFATWTRGSEMPPGTVLVQQLEDGGGSAQWFVMERAAAGGDWSYAVIAPDGTIAAADVGTCADCHRQATSDQVFGPPRPPAGEAHSPSLRASPSSQ